MTLRASATQIRVAREIDGSEHTERFFDLSADMLSIAGVDRYFKPVNRNWSRVLG